ncbi:hypothetical protein GGP41_003858 [Bipolaris sorokiniana]|uniref:Uncharacterized protein n=1 Tax=Cochliobolus sativus TaxID=45130 RepID=A0A8H5ZC14_COCSA|nr:hypothetical protein GGP41_003858 [Bipolaris sorokiniana]
MGFFTDGIASSSSTTIVFEVISGMLEKNPGLRLVADLTYCNLSEFLLVDQLVLHLSYADVDRDLSVPDQAQTEIWIAR